MMPNPLAFVFSQGGAAVLGAMTEALAKARDGQCDCEVCAMLRAATDALTDLAEAAINGDS